MSRSLTCLVLCLLLAGLLSAVGPVLAAPAVQDTLTFLTFSPDALMNTQGWYTDYARSGGFGQFPESYTYRVAEADGRKYLVDSYQPAQIHGQGTAIPLDWDGDPANGLTPLQWQPGMTVAFGVSVYIMPFSPNWSVDGTGQVIWSFGPGMFAPSQAATSDNPPAQPYDWTAGRGPRVQYRVGVQSDGQVIPEPELRAFSPQSATPTLAGKTLPTQTWLDLRLTLTASADGKQALCTVQSRPSGTPGWQDQGSWTCPIDLTSAGADNPAHWNALLLDMPGGQWSKKGYGDPTPQMIDRLDDLTVEVTPPGATEPARTVRMFQGHRPLVGATINGPAALFSDDTPSWQVDVTNGSGAELRGTLSLRSDKDASCSAVLASDLHLADGAQAQFAATLPPLPPGDQKLQVVLRDPAGQEQVVSTSPQVTVFSQRHPVPGVNLVQDASFELGPWFSGTPMREGDASWQTFVKDGNVMRWTPSAAEGWWVEGPSATGVTVTAGVAHSGSSSLRVQAVQDQTRAVESALNRMVPAGPVTLSAWVKTEGCTGRLDLDLDAGWESTGSPTLRQSVTLPASTDWTRLTVTATAPSLLNALARIQVDQGAAWLDDVQIEAASTASAFNVRPQEWLRCGLANGDEASLAKWVRGDRTPRQLTIYNDSRAPLSGAVHVYMGSWDHPTAHDLGSFSASQLAGGQRSRSLTFSTGDLPVEAYVVCLTLEDQGKVVASGLRDFLPDAPIGGTISDGDLRARTAVRFAIAPNIPAAQIFGVGNTMLDTAGGWWGGWTLAGFAEAKPLGLTTYRSQAGNPEEKTYLAAAAGVSIASTDQGFDSTPPGDEALGNPAYPQRLDLYNPAGWAVFLQQAEETGRLLGANPFVVDMQWDNEAQYPNGGYLCPSTYADADFRAWCKQKFAGDLTALNGHWGTSFTSWDQVEQVASASFAEEMKQAAAQQGPASADWLSNVRTLSGSVMARMRQHPGWGLDWMRWRRDSAIRIWTAFLDHVHQFDHKTLYGNNLGWPAFWPGMNMPLARLEDNTQLDNVYTGGLPRGLGTPSEMTDSLEMWESTVPGKPFWGHEIYYQPQWPGEFAALQNWGMIAHGMTNDMIFAWKPYSDHGTPVGTHAWEKPDAWPMWFMIDNDGTRLPGYYSYARSVKEINQFHQRYDGLSLKRAATTVGFYLSPDTGYYVTYDTADRPWNSVWQRTHNTLSYALRMAGVQLSYVDDVTLPAQPGQLRTLIVPASYALSQPAAEKIASFAKAGGTVILAGMSGVMDPWLNKYPNLGGPAWADLNWRAPDFNVENANQVFTSPAATDGPPLFRGTGLGTMPGATPLTGAQGTTIGWERAWGQGKLLAYGIIPDAYTTDPHVSPELVSWLDQWQLYVDLPFTGRWVSADQRKAGQIGEGSAVVDVVVREKSPSEKFVFCLNQGGAGAGAVEIPVGGGNWHATDALTGQAVAGSVAGGIWKTPLSLDALGYRVIRLVKG